MICSREGSRPVYRRNISDRNIILPIWKRIWAVGIIAFAVLINKCRYPENNLGESNLFVCRGILDKQKSWKKENPNYTMFLFSDTWLCETERSLDIWNHFNTDKSPSLISRIIKTWISSTFQDLFSFWFLLKNQ